MPRFPGRVAEAKPGEALVSNTVYAAAGLKLDYLEREAGITVTLLPAMITAFGCLARLSGHGSRA